ncbi:MAG: MogA/MoaB family molybdenum cofactor biosynthesis protein [Anaerolineales bacterium]|nr:MogA/MoaB family molybdenum cofactor biosynthesis protein [Anaerolineales bacterium]MBS3751829.1 MogA/MoaB family molybdenum cofactor biosynthesis protein [Anaerolineales bacterium]
MSFQVAVLTVSDRSFAGEREDVSGPAVAERVSLEGWDVIKRDIVPDDLEKIADIFRAWSDQERVDVILSTGGTGFAPRDVTPDATRAVVERTAPGLTEAMRAVSMDITPHAMLSRAEAGIRKATLIINLPGSPKAAVENLEVVLPVLPHAVALLRGDSDAEKGHHDLNQE